VILRKEHWEKSPLIPLFQRGKVFGTGVPLFEKEGLGEIFEEKPS
jgi:hypothetical protein